MNEEVIKESGYDQKAFLQIRLHELLSRVDKFNVNPLFFSQETNEFNYRVIFNDLKSVLQTIWSKLKEEEKEKANRMRKEIEKIIDLPLFYSDKDANNTTVRYFENELWKKIQEGLFNFRCVLEEYMDSHGFNPSKTDPKGAIIDY